LERARTEFLRNVGFDQSLLRESFALIFVVREIKIRFRKPARFDDLIEIKTQLNRIERSLLIFSQTIYREDTVLIQAEVEIASIDANLFKPIKIPEILLNKFRTLMMEK
jgi:acyl-CoA thioester hydrolase